MGDDSIVGLRMQSVTTLRRPKFDDITSQGPGQVTAFHASLGTGGGDLLSASLTTLWCRFQGQVMTCCQPLDETGGDIALTTQKTATHGRPWDGTCQETSGLTWRHPIWQRLCVVTTKEKILELTVMGHHNTKEKISGKRRSLKQSFCEHEFQLQLFGTTLCFNCVIHLHFRPI